MVDAAHADMPLSETEYGKHPNESVTCRGADTAHLQRSTAASPDPVPTLTDLCRRVINTNLERYPPDSFAILDSQEWQVLMKLRLASTRPKNAGAGGGGLDGTGRLVPCVSHKFLSSVEEANPEFSDCPVMDDLLWKACVEYKFKRGGLTRPPILFLPWPQRIAELQQAVEELQETDATHEERQSALVQIRSSPMNVELLRDSGVGKTVKKMIKKMKDVEIRGQLEKLLQSWMDMAERSGAGGAGGKGGVDMNGVVPSSAKRKPSIQEIDLKLAQSCKSWRQLFAVLKSRNDKVMLNQGKRMREKRQNVRYHNMYIVKLTLDSDESSLTVLLCKRYSPSWPIADPSWSKCVPLLTNNNAC